METIEIGGGELVMRLNGPPVIGLLGEAEFVLGPTLKIILFFVRHLRGNSPLVTLPA
jgi:hypothetical protein